MQLFRLSLIKINILRIASCLIRFFFLSTLRKYMLVLWVLGVLIIELSSISQRMVTIQWRVVNIWLDITFMIWKVPLLVIQVWLLFSIKIDILIFLSRLDTLLGELYLIFSLLKPNYLSGGWFWIIPIVFIVCNMKLLIIFLETAHGLPKLSFFAIWVWWLILVQEWILLVG